MAEIYFDIEVAANREWSGRPPQPRPENCKIITVQYQFLDQAGKGKGSLQIFKEWESTEEEIIRKALQLVNPHSKWDIIPVGQNLNFDLGMIRSRAAIYGIDIPEWFIFNDLPKIDVKAILMGMNGFTFKNSGLEKFSGKESSGEMIPVHYANKEYDKILDYIRKEAEEFMTLYSKLKVLLPKMRMELI